MRHLALIGVLWLLGASLSALAQIQVSAQTERSTFLLYERVDLLITITNIGDTDLVLDNNEGHPWLSFLVSMHSQHNYAPVHQERDSNFAGIKLKAGENKTLRVNLTPLFTFRSEGDYRAAVVIDLPGQGEIMSENVPFMVRHGRVVWSQPHSVDGSPRVYSLLRFSPTTSTTELYLRVEDLSENLVYANIGLGEIVALVDPEIFFDPQGNVHVLHPVAMGTYLYTRTDADGKVAHQTVFKTYQQVAPHLRKLADGNVTVIGGLEDNPNTPRDKLSTGQSANKVSSAEPSLASPPQ